MQRLHVVGFTTDHEGLILSARRGAKSGGYTVNLDADFDEAMAELAKERGGNVEPRIPRAESQLSVREMQQRLRSGQTIQQVARAAGVSDEWVARFAIPIQAEQTQVVRQVFELTFAKQRLGVSAQPLGVSVWWNLQDRSVMLDEEQWESGWNAFLVRDQRWVVRFEYDARKRHQVADWEVDLRTQTLVSRNRLATELGFVEAGRRRRAGPPAPIAGGLVTRPQPPVNDPRSAPSAAASPAGQEPRRGASRAPVRGGITKPAAKKPVTKKPTAKKTPAKRVPVKKTAARKAAPRRTTKAAKKVAARKVAPRPVPRIVAPVPTPASRPSPPAPRVSSVRVAPVVSGGTPARVAVPSGEPPVLTPPPAPSAARRRPLDRNGRPVQRQEPLRAR